jgi:ketosteroid isomerase-like protein
MTADADGAVTALIDDLYAAVLAGDRARFDRHLAPDVTIWESHVATMMHGVDELTAYRDARDERDGPSTLVSLTADDKLFEVFDGVALARYRLVAGTDDAEVEFRVTDVLRDDGVEGWRIVHHHSERQHDPTDVTDPA